ncbi:MAG TPA: hypothetical protein VJZ27_15380 [Aggregatilineales bacterium]|nr:hypothetical protein [Aggregatilineales bacterium]
MTKGNPGSAAIGSGEGLRPKTFFKPFKRKSWCVEISQVTLMIKRREN